MPLPSNTKATSSKPTNAAKPATLAGPSSSIPSFFLTGQVTFASPSNVPPPDTIMDFENQLVEESDDDDDESNEDEEENEKKVVAMESEEGVEQLPVHYKEPAVLNKKKYLMDLEIPKIPFWGGGSLENRISFAPGYGPAQIPVEAGSIPAKKQIPAPIRTGLMPTKKKAPTSDEACFAPVKKKPVRAVYIRGSQASPSVKRSEPEKEALSNLPPAILPAVTPTVPAIRSNKTSLQPAVVPAALPVIPAVCSNGTIIAQYQPAIVPNVAAVTPAVRSNERILAQSQSGIAPSSAPVTPAVRPNKKILSQPQRAIVRAVAPVIPVVRANKSILAQSLPATVPTIPVVPAIPTVPAIPYVWKSFRPGLEFFTYQHGRYYGDYWLKRTSPGTRSACGTRIIYDRQAWYSEWMEIDEETVGLSGIEYEWELIA